MDFTPSPHAGFAAALQARIDAAMVAENAKQPPRNYLGASRLGIECARALGYEYTHTPVDEGKGFSGKTLRIFDMGHDTETRVASYLRLAGFTLLTENTDGKQFGYGVAWDDAKGCYRISGHLDGVIIDGPSGFLGANGLDYGYPCLWENKGLGAKSWNDVVKKGLAKSKPVYHAQMALYQAQMGLADNAALFTALNRDTGELYGELVPFDASVAQAASDRGVRVISAQSPEELPRITTKEDDWRCKFCSWAKRCWTIPTDTASVVKTPTWFKR